jgi:hypothetical protein
MAKFRQIREATRYNPYAIGMAVAKKKAGYGSGPAEDLPKSVIVKGHEIAKKIKANESFDAILDMTEEQLAELSKDTMRSYLAKAPKSARIHGQIASDFEQRSKAVRKPGLKDANTRIAKKYKEKAWNREDNIQKAIDKLAGDK